MKHILLTLLTLTLTSFRLAAQAPVGSVATDFTHSIGGPLSGVTSGTFTTLTASNFAAHEGSVIVACYYTPW